MPNPFRIPLPLLLLLALAIPGTAQSPDDALYDLFDEAWQYRLQANPLFATSVGVHAYNDRLPEVSVAAAQAEREQEEAFLEQLQNIDRSALDRDDQVNYDIFEQVLGRRIAEHDFRTYLMPISNRSGFHISFPQLADRMPLNTVADYEDFIARLQAFDRYAQEHITIMRTGIEEGYVLPAIVLEDAQDAITPHIVDDPEAHQLYDAFASFPGRIGDDERERLRAAGKAAIMDAVVPGYEAFLAFMEEEYMPASRASIAASELPDGEAFYAHRVQYFTTLDLTPEEVHETGLEEVERIRNEMMEIVEAEGFGDDFDGFVEFLRTDEQFYADTPEELMKEVAYVLKQMDGALPELFETLPRMPYGIRPVPDYIAPRTTTAYYQRPAGDGTRAGFYYVNTHDLASRPLYEVEALSLHEAVPGHHLQIALQQELEDLPPFRRFSSFTAFVEGWALYAERLGLEVDGFYEDPYSDFGRLTYEMWRALRLVVDTGMHALDWSRQEAIDFMAQNSALSLHNITTEVDRYIAWPGQALAYKIGELAIRDMRAEAESALGEDFDVRTFHDAVLANGSVPLPVLQDAVDRYIEQTHADAE
ncbi:MAG: DUF885 domain-containing protein [Longimonas sp.]|uniref:DUF885 domain-containing protein n=1 Tax=Longimonas sp. TaxID=2039626 RepID=UPI00335330FD